MMPRVLRCDLDGVRQVLHQLESDTSSELFTMLLALPVCFHCVFLIII